MSDSQHDNGSFVLPRQICQWLLHHRLVPESGFNGTVSIGPSNGPVVLSPNAAMMVLQGSGLLAFTLKKTQEFTKMRSAPRAGGGKASSKYQVAPQAANTPAAKVHNWSHVFTLLKETELLSSVPANVGTTKPYTVTEDDRQMWLVGDWEEVTVLLDAYRKRFPTFGASAATTQPQRQSLSLNLDEDWTPNSSVNRNEPPGQVSAKGLSKKQQQLQQHQGKQQAPQGKKVGGGGVAQLKPLDSKKLPRGGGGPSGAARGRSQTVVLPQNNHPGFQNRSGGSGSAGHVNQYHRPSVGVTSTSASFSLPSMNFPQRPVPTLGSTVGGSPDAEGQYRTEVQGAATLLLQQQQLYQQLLGQQDALRALQEQQKVTFDEQALLIARGGGGFRLPPPSGSGSLLIHHHHQQHYSNDPSLQQHGAWDSLPVEHRKHSGGGSQPRTVYDELQAEDAGHGFSPNRTQEERHIYDEGGDDLGGTKSPEQSVNRERSSRPRTPPPPPPPPPDSIQAKVADLERKLKADAQLKEDLYQQLDKKGSGKREKGSKKSISSSQPKKKGDIDSRTRTPPPDSIQAKLADLERKLEADAQIKEDLYQQLNKKESGKQEKGSKKSASSSPPKKKKGDIVGILAVYRFQTASNLRRCCFYRWLRFIGKAGVSPRYEERQDKHGGKMSEEQRLQIVGALAAYRFKTVATLRRSTFNRWLSWIRRLRYPVHKKRLIKAQLMGWKLKVAKELRYRVLHGWWSLVIEKRELMIRRWQQHPPALEVLRKNEYIGKKAKRDGLLQLQKLAVRDRRGEVAEEEEEERQREEARAEAQVRKAEKLEPRKKMKKQRKMEIAGTLAAYRFKTAAFLRKRTFYRWLGYVGKADLMVYAPPADSEPTEEEKDDGMPSNLVIQCRLCNREYLLDVALTRTYCEDCGELLLSEADALHFNCAVYSRHNALTPELLLKLAVIQAFMRGRAIQEMVRRLGHFRNSTKFYTQATCYSRFLMVGFVVCFVMRLRRRRVAKKQKKEIRSLVMGSPMHNPNVANADDFNLLQARYCLCNRCYPIATALLQYHSSFSRHGSPKDNKKVGKESAAKRKRESDTYDQGVARHMELMCSKECQDNALRELSLQEREKHLPLSATFFMMIFIVKCRPLYTIQRVLDAKNFTNIRHGNTMGRINALGSEILPFLAKHGYRPHNRCAPVLFEFAQVWNHRRLALMAHGNVPGVRTTTSTAKASLTFGGQGEEHVDTIEVFHGDVDVLPTMKLQRRWGNIVCKDCRQTMQITEVLGHVHNLFYKVRGVVMRFGYKLMVRALFLKNSYQRYWDEKELRSYMADDHADGIAQSKDGKILWRGQYCSLKEGKMWCYRCHCFVEMYHRELNIVQKAPRIDVGKAGKGGAKATSAQTRFAYLDSYSGIDDFVNRNIKPPGKEDPRNIAAAKAAKEREKYAKKLAKKFTGELAGMKLQQSSARRRWAFYTWLRLVGKTGASPRHQGKLPKEQKRKTLAALAAYRFAVTAELRRRCYSRWIGFVKGPTPQYERDEAKKARREQRNREQDEVAAKTDGRFTENMEEGEDIIRYGGAYPDERAIWENGIPHSTQCAILVQAELRRCLIGRRLGLLLVVSLLLAVQVYRRRRKKKLRLQLQGGKE